MVVMVLSAAKCLSGSRYLNRASTIAGLDWWTGLVDWTGLDWTGLEWTGLKVSETILQLLESGCLLI